MEKRSRRDVLRLMSGAALLPVIGLPTASAHGDPESEDTQAQLERCRRQRAAELLTLEEVRWLEEHRHPESDVEDLGCELLPDGTVARRRRRTLP